MLSEHSDVKQDYSLLPHHVHDVDNDEYFEIDDVSSCFHHGYLGCCVQGCYGAFVETVHDHVTVNNVGHGIRHGVGHDVGHGVVKRIVETVYFEIDTDGYLGYDHHLGHVN